MKRAIQTTQVGLTEARVQPLLVRPEEGADLARVSRSQFYKMLATKEIRSIKVGRLRRIPVSEIEAWVARQLEQQSA